jgi:hypothetical protein
MRRFVLASFALTALAACQPAGTELTEEQEAAITDTIIAITDEALAALSALDVDRANAIYGRDFAYANNGVIQTDWVSIEAQDRALYGSLQSASGTWGEKHVRVLGHDAAVAVMAFSASFTDTTGVQTDMEGAVTYVFALLDVGWKIISAHVSELSPETP